MRTVIHQDPLVNPGAVGAGKVTPLVMTTFCLVLVPPLAQG